jgi:F-type H+-transporting ATPase subunit epsilon
MADTMQFDLVSPERSLASLKATEVQIPGAEGDLTAMPDHSPVITTLRPGVLRVTGETGVQEYVVTGGFAEITANSTSVLAERALPRDEVTQEMLETWVAEANESLSKARENAPDAVDAAAKLVADMVAVGSEIGIPTTARAPAP